MKNILKLISTVAAISVAPTLISTSSHAGWTGYGNTFGNSYVENWYDNNNYNNNYTCYTNTFGNTVTTNCY